MIVAMVPGAGGVGLTLRLEKRQAVEHRPALANRESSRIAHDGTAVAYRASGRDYIPKKPTNKARSVRIVPGMSECELTNETKEAKAVIMIDGTT